VSRSFERVEPIPSEGGRARAGEVPSELLERIRADAIARTGVAPDELAVLTAESVTWNDGALGCPEAGKMYTMALVPGYHVVLRAGEQELDYRAAASGDFRLCANPPPGGGGDPSS
jgi:hypothetical protein